MNADMMNAKNIISRAATVAAILTILVLALPGIQPVSGEENHTITSRTEWKNTTVNASTIEVRPGGILIVENATILMNISRSGAGIFVDGQLFMNNSVILLSEGSSGPGRGYEFKLRGEALLRDNRIEHPKSIEVFNGSVRITHNTINGTVTDGLYIHGNLNSNKSVVIDNNTISNAGLNGFRLESGRAVLRDNVVNVTAFDGVYVYNSAVEVRDCTFTGLGRFLFYLGMGSTVDVYPGAQEIDENAITITDRDSSVRIHENGNVRTLRLSSPSPTSTHTSLKLLLLVGVAIIGIIGIGYLYFYYITVIKPRKEETIPELTDLSTEEEPEGKKEDVQKLKAYVQRDFGDIAMKGGSFENALEYYNKAIEMNPGDDELYMKRGLVLEKLHKYGEALKDFNTAISLNENNKEAIEGRIRVLDRLEEERKWIIKEIGESEGEEETAEKILKALKKMEKAEYSPEIKYRILTLRNQIEGGDYTNVENEFGQILHKIKEYSEDMKNKDEHGGHLSSVFKKFSINPSPEELEHKKESPVVTDEELEEIKKELETLSSGGYSPDITFQINAIKDSISTGDTSNLQSDMAELREMVRRETGVGYGEGSKGNDEGE